MNRPFPHNLPPIGQRQPFTVSGDRYPWINAESATVMTLVVALVDGSRIRFGSMVPLNNTVKKIADDVGEPDSRAAQSSLMNGVHDTVKGQRHTGISKLENVRPNATTLFVTSRNLIRYPGLIFAVEPPQEGAKRLPVVLKAGISTVQAAPRLLGVLGVKQPSSRRRRG